MSFVTVPPFADNTPGDQDTFNQIIANQEYLNSARITMSYSAYGDTQTDQMKIAVGTIDCNNPNGDYRTRWITAPNIFTPGTRPVGLVTLASTKNRVSTTAIARRTGGTPILDHTGMQCHVRYVLNSTTKLSGPNYINWLMVGY